jgi:NAD-dependent deacetylase
MRSVLDDARTYPITDDIKIGDLAADGGQLRPHIVWFGEAVPMIEVALKEVLAADIFVVVGTSLNVYPAAGLLDYVGPQVPKYVIDKSIPAVSNIGELYCIEKPATTGVAELIKLLGAAG